MDRRSLNDEKPKRKSSSSTIYSLLLLEDYSLTNMFAISDKFQICGQINDPELAWTLLSQWKVDLIAVEMCYEEDTLRLDFVKRVKKFFPGIQIVIAYKGADCDSSAPMLNDHNLQENEVLEGCLIYCYPWEHKRIIRDLCQLDWNKGNQLTAMGTNRKEEATILEDRSQELKDMGDNYDSTAVLSSSKRDSLDVLDASKLNQSRTTTQEIIVIINPKGGVGKTFLAANLASYIAKTLNEDTLIFDTNFGSGDLAVHLDLMQERTITDLIPNLSEVEAGSIDSYLPEHKESGLKAILGPMRPELCEFIKLDHVNQIMSIVKEKYSKIIIDTPSVADNEFLYEITDQATKIILVATGDMASLRQLKTTLEIFKRLSYAAEDKCVIVVNRADPLSSVHPPKIESFLETKIAAVIPEDRRLVEQSILEGKPIIFNRSENQVKTELIRLAERFLQDGCKKEAAEINKGHLISSFVQKIIERGKNNGR